MPMYNLIEYSDIYSEISGILFQYCRDEPATKINKNNIEFVVFTDANVTDSFNLKVRLTFQTGDNGTKYGKTMVPLKYLSNFWRTLEIPLINCEITHDLNWSEKCIMVATNTANIGATFSITDTKLYVLERVNQYLDYLIDPSFQGVDRLFVLPF